LTLREILQSDIFIGLSDFLLDLDLLIIFELILYLLMLWLFFKFGSLMISKLTDISDKYAEIIKLEKRSLTKDEIFMRRMKSIIYLLIGLFFLYLCWLILKDILRWVLFILIEVNPPVQEVDKKSIF